MGRAWIGRIVVLGCALGWAKTSLAAEIFYVSAGNQIKRIEDGVVSTVATGRGLPNYIAIDRTGNLFIADAGDHTVWKLTPDGQSSTFITLTQENPVGATFDAAGNLYVSTTQTNRVYKVTPAGVATPIAAGTLVTPENLTFDPAGNLYIANFGITRGSGYITKVTPGGNVSVIANKLDHPDGLAFDTVGNLYVAQLADNGAAGSIARISPAGIVTSVANTNSPLGIAFAPSGDLYFVNHFTSTLSRISPDGLVTPVVTSGIENARSLTLVPEPRGQLLLLLVLAARRRGRAGRAEHRSVPNETGRRDL